MSETKPFLCRLTPPGEGGISVIEISGPGAAAVLDRLFRNPRASLAQEMPAGRLLYGHLRRGDEILDEVILACVNPGNGGTYEINCHGGAVAARRVMEALREEGAEVIPVEERLRRMAGAGRLDPIAAEAAERLPRAPTLRAARTLIEQYRGALREAIEDALRIGGETPASAALPRLRALLATARFGLGLTEHLRVVLSGRPNVGKSTLANALLRFDRMIVHEVPGTTRDAVEEVFSIRGVPFLLVDTAGLREAGDEIEREGVRRGSEELARADVAVLVLDASQPLLPEDRRLLDGIPVSRRVVAFNKCDLPISPDIARLEKEVGSRGVRVSAEKETGIEALEEAILRAAYPSLPDPGAAVVFTRRQAERLQAAADATAAGDWAAARLALRAMIGENSEG